MHTGAKKNVSLVLVLPTIEEAHIVVLDSEKFQIIISNLLSNAIEYSLDGGVVEISYSVDGQGTLQISVQDHGVGIAPEDQQRIFDRFVQLETGTTRSHLGHGLGLSVAKALVDLLQGSISLVSSLGGGTRFTVTIPPCSILDDNDSFSEAGNLFLFDDMSEA
jgi:signal transduction histidine kinase